MGETQLIKASVYYLTKVGPQGLLITKRYLSAPHIADMIVQFEVQGSGQGEDIVTKEQARFDWEESVKDGYTPTLDEKGNILVGEMFHPFFNPSMSCFPYSSVHVTRKQILENLKRQFLKQEDEDINGSTSYALRA